MEESVLFNAVPVKFSFLEFIPFRSLAPHVIPIYLNIVYRAEYCSVFFCYLQYTFKH